MPISYWSPPSPIRRRRTRGVFRCGLLPRPAMPPSGGYHERQARGAQHAADCGAWRWLLQVRATRPGGRTECTPAHLHHFRTNRHRIAGNPSKRTCCAPFCWFIPRFWYLDGGLRLVWPRRGRHHVNPSVSRAGTERRRCAPPPPQRFRGMLAPAADGHGSPSRSGRYRTRGRNRRSQRRPSAA